MNIKNIVVAASLLAAAGAAMAEAPYPPETPFHSTQTRADVKAELQRAQANHEIVSRNEYPFIRQAPSQLSRQDIEKQVQQANGASQNLYTGA